MLDTKQAYGKKDGVQYYHVIQSFKPGEVTPELALEIAREFAEEHLPGFETVISVHVDKEHIHAHLIFNSVNAGTGRKYHSNAQTYYKQLRAVSDRLCREHGLSVIEHPEQGRTMSYDTWEAEQKGKPTWYSQIRRDVDAAITRSFLFEHFIDNLKRQGYEVKQGKYIAVKPPGKERFVRLKTLGDNYTEEAIRQRIWVHEQTPLYHRLPSPPKRRYKVRGKPKKLTGFRALYYHYLYLLGKLGKPKSSPRKSRYLMDEIIKLDRYMEQFQFLHQYHIDTELQLCTLEEAIQADLDTLTTQRTDLYRQRRKDPDNEALLSEIESINQSIRGRRKELRICVRIEADIPRIRQKTFEPIPLPPKREKPLAKRKTRPLQR